MRERARREEKDDSEWRVERKPPLMKRKEKRAIGKPKMCDKPRMYANFLVKIIKKKTYFDNIFRRVIILQII